jgi:hypothetical protein
MGSRDFLHRDAETRLCEYYVAAGAVCSLSTNFAPILEAARQSFVRLSTTPSRTDFSLRFWVDAAGRSQPPWPKPYCRGLDHLVFAGFDTESSVSVDLHTRRAIGRFSPTMGADQDYWKAVIFPVLLSVMGASVGITELHCAGVARNGEGLLLAGPSGSGKSTLAVALAQEGFEYVSDDRIYCSLRESRLSAWGLPTALKLRSDAAHWFPELEGLEPEAAPNGEWVFQHDPERCLGLERARCCEPQWLVFLTRQEGSEFCLTQISFAEAAIRLEAGLMEEAPEAVEMQRGAIAKLVKLPCWLLRYGGRPQDVAEQLARHITGESDRAAGTPDAAKLGSGPRSSWQSIKHSEQAVSSGFALVQTHPGIAGTGALASRGTKINVGRSDPLRRLTLTPHVADLPVMGRTIRLETNSPTVLKRTLQLFERYRGSSMGIPDFLWKIVSESNPQMRPPWPQISAFSGDGLRFVNIGQRSFLAIDLEAREAVAYLAEGLVADGAGFACPFIDTLFCMTAGALRLTALHAACVTKGEKGVLVLGMPDSGKTTSGYLASKLGLEFHSDQAVFVDMDDGTLRIWGDFLPAVFRAETSRFLPELEALARPFCYLDSTFLCVDKGSPQLYQANSVTSVSCVFLERGATSVPRLTPLSRVESSRRLQESLLFKDDERFEAQESAALRTLTLVPAYHLAYGNDPAEAAALFPSLLSAHQLPEVKP